VLGFSEGHTFMAMLCRTTAHKSGPVGVEPTITGVGTSPHLLEPSGPRLHTSHWPHGIAAQDAAGGCADGWQRQKPHHHNKREHVTQREKRG